VRRRPLPIIIVAVLVVSIALSLALMHRGQPPSDPTLTILSMAEGNVLVKRAGTSNWIAAQIGMSLVSGDAVKSGSNSSAEITFFEGSTIGLEADTELEVVSLAISGAGSTSIGLRQSLGTTISRVAKLVDTASGFEIETQAGVAAVRGSVMIVRVSEDCETWITNQEGSMSGIAQGVELQIPVGRVCIIVCGQPPRLVPLPDNGEGEGSDGGEGGGGGDDGGGGGGGGGGGDDGGGGGGGGGSNSTATDLAISKSGSPDAVAPGGHIIYTLQVINGGPSNATGVVILDALPSSASFVSATDGGVYHSGSHTVAWVIGGLARDASTSVSVLVKVDESASQGSITNIATVSANERDSNRANDTGTEHTVVDDEILNNPPVSEDDVAATDEDNPVTVAAPGVLGNDFDSDIGDILTVIAVDTYWAKGAVTAWHADGSFTYDPNGQFEYLKAGDSASDSFSYTVSDGRGGIDTATVTITVHGANDAPTNISLDSSSIAENQPPGTPVGSFSTTDPDTGDTSTYSLVSGPGDTDNASFTVVGNELRTADSFDYEAGGSFSIRVRVTDSGGLHYEQAFIITVTKANEPPVALDDSATTAVDTAVTIDVLANDFDADGDTLTVVSVTQGAHGSVVNNGDDVTYSPDSGFTGTDGFTYTISDGEGGTDTATVTIAVTATGALTRLSVQIDTGPIASIYIWNDTTGSWAIDEVTGKPVDGTNHMTSAIITVAGGYHYYVWVEAAGVTYYVKNCPKSWIIAATPVGDGEAAYGYAAPDRLYSIHFTSRRKE